MKSRLNIFLIAIVLIAVAIFLTIVTINQIKILNAKNKADKIVIGDKKDTTEIDKLPIISEETNIGTLTIPSILLENAPITEGIELDNLSNAIGHFPTTNIYNGNVGLASHNRGNADYFKNIHKLKIGDVIYYQSIYGTKRYLVENITKIQETDFSYLQSTQDNKITLITCISNKPELRLCIQAKEF